MPETNADTITPDITLIDTLLGGETGLTAAYLIRGERLTLVETGSQTSAESLIANLIDHGIGPDDLDQIVLTHIHLDHCGGVGDVMNAFPRARLYVHRRGARHLAEPTRLLESSFAVYGDLAPIYGGLVPVAPERIEAVEEGGTIPLGGGRRLEVMDAPGHARHQMALLDTGSGSLFTGDALGVRFPGSELYPTLPPPDFNLDMALTTLDRIAERGAERLLLPHFGAIDEPETAIAVAAERQATLAEAARRGWRAGGTEAAVGEEIDRTLPVADVVIDDDGRRRWQFTLWADNNVTGLALWAESVETPAEGGE